jgi:hypothetical protein
MKKYLLVIALLAPASAAFATVTTVESSSPIPEKEKNPPNTAKAVAEKAKVPVQAIDDLRQKDVVQAAGSLVPTPKDGKFKSIVPILAYEPTRGGIIGAGYFFKKIENGKDVSNWGLAGLVGQRRKASQFLSIGEVRLSDRWKIKWKNDFNNGFETNYGDGNLTKVEDRVDVPMWRNETDLFFPYYINDHFSVGPAVEHRMRRNNRIAPADQDRQVDPISPSEFTVGAGIRQVLDFRDITENPTIGWREEFRLTAVQPYSGNKGPGYFIAELQLATFEYLLNRDLILANALSMGFASANPSYLDQFRLGGATKLRGYFRNRFRGRKYYVAQSELRFPIFKMVGGCTILEFGEASNQGFGRPHLAYGLGLRIGVPPDEVSKIRIDFAIGQDQRGFTVDFGHAF